jgi:hypothetical protein
VLLALDAENYQDCKLYEVKKKVLEAKVVDALYGMPQQHSHFTRNCAET